MTEEIWRDIAGYEGLYQVSNLGRVKSFKRKAPRILKLKTEQDGYLRVGLNHNGKPKTCSVHRLVALAFIPNPESKPEVNHLNGIKADCHVENLAWATSSENQQHACDTGLQGTDENNPQAKFTNEQVRYIRDNPDNLTQRQLAEMFGVDRSTISLIQRNKTYRKAGGKKRPIKSCKKTPRLSDEKRAEICRLYVRGSRKLGSSALAKKYEIDPTTVLRIVKEQSQRATEEAVPGVPSIHQEVQESSPPKK